MNHLRLLDDIYRNERHANLAAEAFVVAQHAQISNASQAVARLAARFAGAGSALARMLRERQDLIERWRSLDTRLAPSPGAPTDRPEPSASQIREWQVVRKEIEVRLRGIDRNLRTEFPRFAEFTTPQPLSVAEVRQMLRSDEAVLMQATTEEATFLWLIQARAPARFVSVSLGREQLNTLARHTQESISPADPTRRADLPPFDTASAYELYRALFAPFEDALRQIKQLIFVPDEALRSLPIGLLLTCSASAPGRPEDCVNLAWLGRDTAISYLPSVSALRALRVLARQSVAWKPFLGIGETMQSEISFGSGNGPGFPGTARHAQITPAAAESWPRTAHLLRDLARALGGNSSDLLLNAQATESALKTMGDLRSFRVVAFATPGRLIDGRPTGAEPALLLTSTGKSDTQEDGLLTASEIASLDLNAEWVVLAGCDTANLDVNADATGLVELVNSFFFAGARALLVSHWNVDPETAASIATRTLELLAQTPGLGRSEALRRAIRPFMDGYPAARLAHPYFWAPFAVVGDGSADLGAAWQ